MPVFGGQSIVSDKVLDRDYSTFIKTEKDNITFTLNLSLLDGEFTPQMNEFLGKILGQTRPITFELGEDRQKMLYVVPTSEFEIQRLQGYKGILPITFEATTPYWLTPIETRNLTLQYNDTFNINNRSNVQNQDGNYDWYPYFRFTIASVAPIITEAGGYVLTESAGYALTESSYNVLTESYSGFDRSIINTNGSINFKITHISDNNRVIAFDSLNLGETIEMQDIYFQQSSTGLSRFANWNKEPFKLHEGNNEFRVNFPCNIIMSTQYPIIR